MFEFAHTENLWLLWVIPLMLLIYLILRYKRKSVIRRIGQPDLLSSLMPTVSSRRPVLKFILLLISLIFIILAIAGPRSGSRMEEVKREGVEIIIVLDVSRSMLAEDISPNRLERSKMAVSRLIRNLKNDRIGLIVFAGDAFVQIPITADHAAARMILENVFTDIVPVQGTSIGKAIELAARSFTPDSPASRTIIIISDGEDHEDDPVNAARIARTQGISIHAIGMGRPEGAPVPVSAVGESRFLTDQDGNTVITRLDETTLREIAAAGEGLFIRAGSSGTAIEIIMKEIEEMDKVEFDEMIYTEYEEHFQYMAGLALLLLIFDFLILDRKNKWLNSIKLFK